MSVFNYPCVVDAAPRSSHGGHSSHVMNIKFTAEEEEEDHSDAQGYSSSRGRGRGRGEGAGQEARDGLKLVTVGGNDNAAMTWAVR